MALRVDSLYEPYSCPPLTDQDYRTASRGASRKPSRRGSVSPMSPSSAHTPMAKGESHEQKEEKISILDPRRFTPTLHANLVSEILSLRRELESKNSLVLNLEESLVSVKDENMKLHEVVAHNTKENRTLKRQMDTLEESTLVALEELAGERNKANESLADLRVRLDSSQKKLRSHQEDSTRSQTIWDTDKEKWEAERRILERKVHVVEGRLKTVLTEVATSNMNGHPRPSSDGSHRAYSRERPGSRASGTRSSASRHRDSFGNEIHERAARFSSGMALSGNKTLADELDFGYSDGESDGDLNSPEALPEEATFRPRPYSVQSHRQSVKAKKLLGLNIDGDEESETGRDSAMGAAHSHPVEVFEVKPKMQPSYVDTATQYSPPPSPDLTTLQRLSTIDEIENDHFLDDVGNKQAMLQGLPSGYRLSMLQDARQVVMVSSACQTIETPLSPPETPVGTSGNVFHHGKVEMITASTQTTEYSSNSLQPAASRSVATEVPTIAIHPAVSGSARSSVVLPPNSQNAATQANILGDVTSVAVQTEGIRTDERLFKLPAHLHPEIIPPFSPVPSPASSSETEIQETKNDRKSQSIALRSSLQVSSRSPSLLKQQRRSRLSQITTNLDLNDDLDEGHVSDDSFLTKEPIHKVLSRVDHSWKLVASPTDVDNFTDTEDVPPTLPDLKFGTFDVDHNDYSPETQKTLQQKFEERSGKVITPINTGRPDIRRAALIANGAAAHNQRARSPSEPAALNHGKVPPFPVPDRSSSKKLSWPPSDPGESPTTQSTYSHERSGRIGRPPSKRPAIRKSRSAAATNHWEDRSRSRSPPPFESFTESLIHIPPPLPENEITSPFSGSFRKEVRSSHLRAQPSRSESAVSDQTTVVDSIAATMVGEWMWKYVRRRKSFGLGEVVGGDHENGRTGDGIMNGGIRHARWVWVAPYERAIMWSSKQPVGGTALMGKSGRKLVISSVLDVRDDNPMPKGAPPSSSFGRSILVLTPLRALKFTAGSIERHYVWLSALSFLSHKSIEIPGVGYHSPSHSPLPLPLPLPSSRAPSQQSFHPAPVIPPASLRRSRIQDSIRIAKGKERPSPGARRVFTTPSYITIPEAQPDNLTLIEHDEDGAEAPQVPRRSADTRKRSNANQQSRPANSMKSYSSITKPSLPSLRSRRNSNSEVKPPFRPPPPPPQRHFSEGPTGGLESIGRKGPSSLSLDKSLEASNFFETVGTVRMDAFSKDQTANYVSNTRRRDGEAINGNGRPQLDGKRSISDNIGKSQPKHIEQTAPVNGTTNGEKKKSKKAMGFRRKFKKQSSTVPVVDGGSANRSIQSMGPKSPTSTIGAPDPFEGF